MVFFFPVRPLLETLVSVCVCVLRVVIRKFIGDELLIPLTRPSVQSTMVSEPDRSTSFRVEVGNLQPGSPLSCASGSCGTARPDLVTDLAVWGVGSFGSRGVC